MVNYPCSPNVIYLLLWLWWSPYYILVEAEEWKVFVLQVVCLRELFKLKQVPFWPDLGMTLEHS